MKNIKFLLSISMLFFWISSCAAQASFVKVTGAKHGNTARRGMLPKDENGNFIEPEPGHDFYTIELVAKKNCVVETQIFWLGNSTCYPLTINNEKTKVKYKKGEKIVLTANSMVQPRPSAPLKTPKGQATLEIIINGKKYWLGIEKFEEILPN